MISMNTHCAQLPPPCPPDFKQSWNRFDQPPFTQPVRLREGHHPSNSHFLAVHYDVLQDVFELLRQNKALQPLSMTCKAIREACMPYLFRHARVDTGWEIMSGRLVETSSDIWLYVRHLTLRGTWANKYDRPSQQRIDLGALQEPLRDFLSSMPLLHTISLTGGWNGVPWDAFKTLLPVARLRHFKLGMTPDRGRPYPVDEEPFIVAPLETFEVTFDGVSANDDPYVGERSLFEFVVPQVSETLESLRLPLESAPLARLAASPWPRLRKLSLWGDRSRSKDCFVPFNAVLSGMSGLRSLVLLYSQKDDVERELVWLNGSPWKLSFPDLESLTLSYPDPEDGLFSSLPQLRRLSLRCWPRHYLHQFAREKQEMDRNGWKSPITTSSEMLAVLRKCPSDALEELEIEYKADDRDAELLQSLSVLYPRVKVLTLLRYRSDTETEVPINRLAHDLSTMAHVRVMRLHLDLPNAPDPESFYPHEYYADIPEPPPGPPFASSRQAAAEELARHLSSSLRLLCVLTRQCTTNDWYPYSIARDGCGMATGITAELVLNRFEGLSLRDGTALMLDH